MSRFHGIKLGLFGFIMTLGLMIFGFATAQQVEPKLLALQDKLDRAEDGYCLDMLGSGGYFRVDMPLMGHNCKPGLAADEIVSFGDDGFIRFPAFDLCTTAMGVNGSVLPGIALMVKPCGENSPFLSATDFQSFEWTQDQKIRLKGSDLCMVMGAESHATFHPDHRWRRLSLENCSESPYALSRWALIDPLS